MPRPLAPSTTTVVIAAATELKETQPVESSLATTAGINIVALPSQPESSLSAMSPPVVAPSVAAPPVIALPIIAPPVVAPPVIAPPVIAPPVIAAPIMAAPIATAVSVTVATATAAAAAEAATLLPKRTSSIMALLNDPRPPKKDVAPRKSLSIMALLNDPEPEDVIDLTGSSSMTTTTTSWIKRV
jgi:hypothetical protein